VVLESFVRQNHKPREVGKEAAQQLHGLVKEHVILVCGVFSGEVLALLLEHTVVLIEAIIGRWGQVRIVVVFLEHPQEIKRTQKDFF